MNTEITYTIQGDYLLPDLTLPEQDYRENGVFFAYYLLIDMQKIILPLEFLHIIGYNNMQKEVLI